MIDDNTIKASINFVRIEKLKPIESTYTFLDAYHHPMLTWPLPKSIIPLCFSLFSSSFLLLLNQSCSPFGRYSFLHCFDPKFGVVLDRIPLLCDNESAVKIANNPVQHSRTKHIDIRPSDVPVPQWRIFRCPLWPRFNIVQIRSTLLRWLLRCFFFEPSDLPVLRVGGPARSVFS